MRTGTVLTRGALALTALALAGCTIPRAGPYGSEIVAGAGETPGVRIERIAELPAVAPPPPPQQFNEAFRRAAPSRGQALATGDVLQIQVWEEAVSPSAEGSVGEASISLPRVEIDETGEVFVPFAGRVRAAGRSVSAFHEALTGELAKRLVNPQVSVSRVAAPGNTANVIGDVTATGPIDLSATNKRLMDVLTRAGGPSEPADVSRVTVMRGAMQQTLWLDDVYRDRANDIAIFPGDTVLVERDKRTFIVLGAVNEQTAVPFPARRVSLMRALAEANGLNDRLADPTGVFVFRRSDSSVHILDMNRSDGMLLADRFEIADGDMVYVTNAPFTTWLKIVSGITPAIGLAGSVYAITGAN